MELELLCRYLHFICIITIAGALTVEHLLLKPRMSRRELDRMARIDLVYGISAIVLVIAGLTLWLWVGKPAEFYSKNWIFHLKLTLAIAMGLMSLPPTFFFLKNRKGDPDEMVDLPKSLIRWIRFELFLLVILPLLAVLMARGIGAFE